MARKRRRLLVIICTVIILVALIISVVSRRSEVKEMSNKSKRFSHDISTGGQSTHSLNYNIHIFYYPWYGNPDFDSGSYYHWNHEYLPHWDKEKARNDIFAGKKHKPPDDIGSNFYPMLNAYSNRDPAVIHKHMEWISSCGAGVLVVSWYPPNKADDSGRSWDDLILLILDTANLFNLKVAFHLEPYKERTAQSVQGDIKYVIETYSRHPAFYYYDNLDKKSNKKVRRALFYVYDSYLIPYDEWAGVLKAHQNGSSSDVYLLGLLVKAEDKAGLVAGGFDGFYTYFGANAFSYGSTQSKWADLTDYGRSSYMISSISVAPGYVDDRVRRWNSATTKDRRNGEYYMTAWKIAAASQPDIISITSFNEWHEGTQIEPSVPKSTATFTYLDYTPNEPEFYLRLTKTLIHNLM